MIIFWGMGRWRKRARRFLYRLSTCAYSEMIGGLKILGGGGLERKTKPL